MNKSEKGCPAPEMPESCYGECPIWKLFQYGNSDVFVLRNGNLRVRHNGLTLLMTVEALFDAVYRSSLTVDENLIANAKLAKENGHEYVTVSVKVTDILFRPKITKVEK